MIHMNGTGKTALEAEYKTAYQAVKAAFAAVAAVTVHGRDYYIGEPGAYYQAREARDVMLRSLDDIRNELAQVRMEIADQ